MLPELLFGHRNEFTLLAFERFDFSLGVHSGGGHTLLILQVLEQKSLSYKSYQGSDQKCARLLTTFSNKVFPALSLAVIHFAQIVLIYVNQT